MSVSNSRINFGIHQVTPYNRTTGEAYGFAKVLGEASVDLSGEQIKLYGGSQKFPHAIEEGNQNAEVSIKFKELPDWMFELFQGKAPTISAADTAGTCSALTNKSGTTAMSATIGVATATVKVASKGDLKFSKFLMKVVSATTVDIYAMSDVDFNRGTDKSYENDLTKVTAAPLTVATGAAVEIPGFGVELTGGSGIIGMTIGHTATFEVKPPSTVAMEVTIGGSSDIRPEFGLIIVGQQRGNGEMMELDIFRCKASGFPLPFAEKAFQEMEVKVEAFYDSAKNGVLKLRHITPS